MKYRYFYQTSKNENRDGWIDAPNRAEAYAALRKRGIKPYRVAGDDPSPWRRRGLVAAAAAAPVIAAAAAFAAATLLPPKDETPLSRRQIGGDAAAVFAGVEDCWQGVFDTRLDRRLAAYAQPGWIAIPPEEEPGERENYANDLAAKLRFPRGERAETRTLRRIVAGMRGELSVYLKSGGTIDGYLDFLEERQNDEAAFRRNAREIVEAAKEKVGERAEIDMNARLRAMGLPEL